MGHGGGGGLWRGHFGGRKFGWIRAGGLGFDGILRNEAILGAGGHGFQGLAVATVAFDLVGGGQGAVVGLLDLRVIAEERACLPFGGVDESFGDAFVGPVVGAAQVLPVAGLDAVEAEEAPVGVREFLDQGLLGGVGGGGVWSASPSGAPSSTQVLTVWIPLSDRRRSFRKLPCAGSASQGGIARVRTRSRIAFAQGRTSL